MKKLIYITAVILIAAVGCRKKDDHGGTIVGSATLDAQVQHHSWAIPQCKVYIKKNCSTFPGHSPSLYNSVVISDNSGWVHFESLGNATYLLYAIGYDPVVADSVWGYNTITINNIPGEVKNYELVVPVSE
jgi:hypothetical protein